MIEDYLARQSLPEEAEAGFENYQESTTGEVNESTTEKNESTKKMCIRIEEKK